ncbi:hypothetical protein DIS24_g890 [Lasiodiplodia hormozganensis]|uniref:Uncharacterized protein n=1 Tax=Lasiodiplodia hormozganensis TaxID=869390 RepID=A0AA39Z3N0_9PEZI|nr:hypothetical protein DIS24_g890 [Lasiodiplodia hormozganensis]
MSSTAAGTTSSTEAAASTAGAASTAAAASSTTLATSTRSSSTFVSPAAVTVALTTTFTPPPACTENQLTLLSSPWYNIWLNEPSPVPGSLFTDCYPSQFISGYTSVFNMTSSIAPVFSPLVCPEAWETVNTFSSSYIACCPSGYALHPPATTVDTNRPAYGGTCYSPVVLGSTYTVTAYNASTLTATQAWPATNSGDQFFAHVIEGYALSLSESSSSSTASASASASSSTIPTVTATPSSDSSSISGGAIAGIVIGVCAALALLLAGVFFFLRRRRQASAKAAAAAAAAAGAAENGHRTSGHEVDGSDTYHEKVGDQEYRRELPGWPGSEGGATHEMESPSVAHELETRGPVELDASERLKPGEGESEKARRSGDV